MKSYQIAALACIVIGIGIGKWLGDDPHVASVSDASAQSTLTASSQPRELWGESSSTTLTQDEMTNIRVYETVNPSVVNIDTKTTIQIDMFFGLQREAEGTGSGAVVDKEGHIITNYHVIDGAERINVTLASNEQYLARLIGGDREQDIAVLKIDAPAELLKPIPIGSSNSLRVGQRVYALGNPFGWDGTMSMGIVSSLNRNLPSRVPGRQMQSLIQTDAAMNPGNSGGPLVDSSGRMVGMCVAIAGTARQNSGVGFAIPVNRIRAMLPELIENGRIVRADIGIHKVMETSRGLVVVSVEPDGPADKAGLQGFRRVVERNRQGAMIVERSYIDRSHADRITAVNGEPVSTGVGFLDQIYQYRPGETVTLTIVRDGSEQKVDVTLGAD